MFDRGGPTYQLSLRQKIGAALTGLLLAGSATSALAPTPGGEIGPPYVVLVAGSLLSVSGLIALLIGFVRRSRSAFRLAAGALIAIQLTALPAFFAPVPASTRLMVAVSVLLADRNGASGGTSAAAARSARARAEELGGSIVAGPSGRGGRVSVVLPWPPTEV
jgi:hypothetical protein